MPDEYSNLRLNPDARPYETYPDCPESSECDYCGEGWELPAGHTHEMYENWEGASHRTADELVDIFLDSCEFYAAPWQRPEWCPRDVEGWCDDPDDAQALHDSVALGESALSAVGLSVSWEDGYVIERITEPTTVECVHCHRAIVNVGGAWIDPDATGDDAIWRHTCDAHDTFTAEHEPTNPNEKG